MRTLFLLPFVLISISLNAQSRFDVASQSDFNSAQQQATFGDTIVWASGIYSDTRMDINTDGIIITAEPYGTVLFKGASRAVINSNNVTFAGFQYVGGAIGNLDVIRIYGSDILVSHINIQNYTCFKYMRVYEESRRTTISYCNFENRLNLDDQNILSILVDDEPGYHKIQYCSFKNFDGIGNDQGIEPIRIGVSSQGDLDSRTLVEYCYFTQCNGDGEIISHKSRQNVYRYNTFEDNPVAELVLRHGDEGIVYGNFFLDNMGGIRVREGSDHYIFNNYFDGLNRRSIFLQNDPSDPLSQIHIYHNTVVNSEEIILGGSGNNPPSEVFVYNNIFTQPKEQLFDQDTGSETWFNNVFSGNLGIDVPTSGLTIQDPELLENPQGFFQPNSDSPIIGAAGAGYPLVPLFEGMDYDNNISLDIMREDRPASIPDRAIGASEYSPTVNAIPHVNELDTGPVYLFDQLVDYVASNSRQLYIGEEGETRSINISSNVDWELSRDMDWISSDLISGTGDAQVDIIVEPNTANTNRRGLVTITSDADTVFIDVFQDAGQVVSIHESDEDNILLFPNPTNGKLQINALPSSSYKAATELVDVNGKIVHSYEYQITNNELTIDIENLSSGTYLLQVQLLNVNGKVESELIRKILKI